MTIPNCARLVGVLVILGACETPAGGRWPQKGVADREKANPPVTVVMSQDLRLQVSVERDSFVLGEPVYLLVRLENTGEQTQRVFGSLDPIDGASEILVRGNDGQERRFSPLVEADHDESTMVELAPHRPIGAVVPVFFGANGWTFATAGTYSVTAIYHTPAGNGQYLEARSPALSIPVTPTADGSGEFLVGESAASLEAGKFLTWQAGDHLTAGREHLQNLLERYPNSVLTHYVRSALSRSYGRRFMDYTTRRVRPPDCDLALEHLRGVADERLPGFVRVQNALTRARCAARGKDGAGARAAIKQARGIAGELPEYRAMVTQIDELERNLGAPGRQGP